MVNDRCVKDSNMYKQSDGEQSKLITDIWNPSDVPDRFKILIVDSLVQNVQQWDKCFLSCGP